MKNRDLIPDYDPQRTWAERRDIPITILGWILVILILVWLLLHISHAIILLIIAAFLAYALVPAIVFLDKYMPRFLAMLIVYLLVFGIFGVTIFYLISTVVSQLGNLSHTLVSFLTPQGEQNSALLQLFQKFGLSQHQLTQATEQVGAQAEKLAGSIVPLISGIFSSVLDTLLVAILSIYLLTDGERILVSLQKNIPHSSQGRLQFLLNTLQKVVGGYIRGQIFLALVIGVLIGIGMAAFQVPYAVLLGFLAFLLAFIPIIGTLISGALCVLLALTHGWLVAISVLIYFIFLHILEGDILGPRIVGKSIGLSPVVSIFALVAGTELFGIVGALFAAPTAGVIQVLLHTIWLEWKESHPQEFTKGRRYVVETLTGNLPEPNTKK